MNIAIKNQLEIYVSPNGETPFIHWLESLDNKTRYRVKERLDRVVLGNLGDFKAVSEGVFELRLPFGPGYRIYFGKQENILILLLCAGDKKSQKADIKKAKHYWLDYLNRSK